MGSRPLSLSAWTTAFCSWDRSFQRTSVQSLRSRCARPHWPRRRRSWRARRRHQPPPPLRCRPSPPGSSDISPWRNSRCRTCHFAWTSRFPSRCSFPSLDLLSHSLKSVWKELPPLASSLGRSFLPIVSRSCCFAALCSWAHVISLATQCRFIGTSGAASVICCTGLCEMASSRLQGMFPLPRSSQCPLCRIPSAATCRGLRQLLALLVRFRSHRRRRLPLPPPWPQRRPNMASRPVCGRCWRVSAAGWWVS
mmetsp:Transcript_866/g.2372  ORF Transcript_866/g.2372 Transcript_866/m.2372 type:complete len:252 (+) Transcript_866:54-809(+)